MHFEGLGCDWAGVLEFRGVGFIGWRASGSLDLDWLREGRVKGSGFDLQGFGYRG